MDAERKRKSPFQGLPALYYFNKPQKFETKVSIQVHITKLQKRKAS